MSAHPAPEASRPGNGNGIQAGRGSWGLGVCLRIVGFRLAGGSDLGVSGVWGRVSWFLNWGLESWQRFGRSSCLICTPHP